MRRLLCLPVIVGVLGLACGGSESPTAPTGPQVVAKGQSPSLPSSSDGSTNTVAATHTVAFTIAAKGTIEGTVDWAGSANRFGIALYPSGCVPATVGYGACFPIAQGSSYTKPTRVTLSGADAGSYTLGFINLGPGTDSGNYEITVTR